MYPGIARKTIGMKQKIGIIRLSSTITNSKKVFTRIATGLTQQEL